MKKLFFAVMIPTIIAIGILTYNFNALYNNNNKTEYTAESRSQNFAIPVVDTAKNINTETENIETKEVTEETETSTGTKLSNPVSNESSTTTVQGTQFTNPVVPTTQVVQTTPVETKVVEQVKETTSQPVQKTAQTKQLTNQKTSTTSQTTTNTQSKKSTTNTQPKSNTVNNTVNTQKKQETTTQTQPSQIQAKPQEQAQVQQTQPVVNTTPEPVTQPQPQQPVNNQEQTKPVEQKQETNIPTSTTDFSQYVYTGDDGYVHFLYTGTGEKNIIVPEGVQTIDGFSKLHKPNTEIEYIHLPKSLEEIMLVQAFSEEGDNQWYYALYECINLKRVDLEDTWHYQYRATADGKRVYRQQNITAWQYGVRVPYNESDYFK